MCYQAKASHQSCCRFQHNNLLNKLVQQRWDEYSQDSLDRSIESTSGRLESVLRGKGKYLMEAEDY